MLSGWQSSSKDFIFELLNIPCQKLLNDVKRSFYHETAAPLQTQVQLSDSAFTAYWSPSTLQPIVPLEQAQHHPGQEQGGTAGAGGVRHWLKSQLSIPVSAEQPVSINTPYGKGKTCNAEVIKYFHKTRISWMESGAFTITGTPKASRKVRSLIWSAAVCYTPTSTKPTEGLDEQNLNTRTLFHTIMKYIIPCTADAVVFYRCSCSENQTKAVVSPKGKWIFLHGICPGLTDLPLHH